ncbi:MAG: hypothetical protein ACR2OB_14400 [Solirubrobacteraceae bacterium]
MSAAAPPALAELSEPRAVRLHPVVGDQPLRASEAEMSVADLIVERVLQPVLPR